MAISDLLIRLGVKGDKTAKNKLRGVSGSLGSLAKSAVLAGGAFFGARALVNGLKQTVKLAGEQELAEKKLNAVLKSTGGVSGATSQELLKLASSLQQVTTFGDEAIIGANSLLLTFTSIGNDVMPQAMETILNMSEAMGQDLQSATLQLGKALNDPVKGVSALSRVGVQLTETQIQQIKTFDALGDTASAQKVILGELETQFGGLARASATTFSGAMQQLGNIVGDTAEKFGELLLPSLNTIIPVFKNIALKAGEFFEDLKNLDFGATFSNMLEQSQFAMELFGGLFKATLQFLPDIFFATMSKLIPILQGILMKLIDHILVINDMFWEPIFVAFIHLGDKIKSYWNTVINGLLTGINFLIEKLNLIPLFDNIPTINLLDKIQVDPLLDKLADTELSKIFGSEDDVDTLGDLLGRQKELYADYFNKIKVLKDKDSSSTVLGEGIKSKAIGNTTETTKEGNEETKKGFQTTLGGIRNAIKAYLAQAIGALLAKESGKGLTGLITGTAGAVAMTALFDKHIPKFATGGIVQGNPHQGDVQPAMLTAGELILNQSQQDQLVGNMGGVTINIAGNFIGEESYVRDNLIPEIERVQRGGLA